MLLLSVIVITITLLQGPLKFKNDFKLTCTRFVFDLLQE